MKDWRCSKSGGLLAFLAVALLVAGGLGWATWAALRLEDEQNAARAEAEQAANVRLALWQLDCRVAPLLAREDSRPFDHYNAVSSPAFAFHNTGSAAAPGAFIVPSPLLYSELPDWMLLHFQADSLHGWDSPQVPSNSLTLRLRNEHVHIPFDNVDGSRRARLDALAQGLSVPQLVLATTEHSADAVFKETSLQVAPAPRAPNNELMQNNSFNNQYTQPQQGQNERNYQEFEARNLQQVRRDNDARNGSVRSGQELTVLNPSGKSDDWFTDKPAKHSLITETHVQLRAMKAFWLPVRGGSDQLVVMRLVKLNGRASCQGILLDDQRLQELLTAEVSDLFPNARLLPVKEAEPPRRDRTMTALPFELDTGPLPPPPAVGWTPLRFGLTLAWSAALIALLAVGLGGWSLLDFSERRIRFVSAVTHELRTPLTTLRLYLDMLMNGLVRDEQQRTEYIATLHAEAERLNRLVGNVLDFSRLEKQRPHLNRSPQLVSDLLAQLQDTWQTRCQNADKELLIESSLPQDALLNTDGELLQQVVGNLLDNACKYSRHAQDRRLWLRVRVVKQKTIFEVEDRGPGVPASERRAIFHAFRRGNEADVTAGGVGLGLALAKRWAHLLGGRLSLAATPAEGGACFRLELPRG